MHRETCEARKTLKIYALAVKIGVDTVEIELRKGSEILYKENERKKKVDQFTAHLTIEEGRQRDVYLARRPFLGCMVEKKLWAIIVLATTRRELTVGALLKKEIRAP